MMYKPKDWTVDYFVANEVECLKILDHPDALKEIPLLNSNLLEHFKHGQLVRFQGMLQDMHNPELFFKSYQVVDKATGEVSTRCGMYKDGASCQKHEEILSDSSNNETSERQTWFVISTPGLNDWAKEECSTVLEHDVTHESQATCLSNKRSLDETDEPMDCSEPAKKKEKVDTNDREAGPSQPNGNSTSSLIVSRDHLLNFPIPNENGKSCLVKVYKESPFKLNQIVDIIGFVSLDLTASYNYSSDEIDNSMEMQTHHPPASLVPRLHAVKVTKELNNRFPDAAEVLATAESVRGDLRVVLTQLLFGDEIAADYLICHLISSVYVRKDCLSLGAFALNITNFPVECETFTKDFYDIVKEIIAKSYFLNITLTNLNDLNFVPKKDYECDRLTSGVLQLSNNTHLILDETKLVTGQLTTSGTLNYKSISDLIQFQKLSYDFKFYTIDYETDIPILILSTTKSFIPCEFQVVLKPDPGTVKIYPQVLEAAKQYMKNGTRINNLRAYVNALKNAVFSFSEETLSIIQEDFVRLRQADGKFSADNLHSLLVLTRLMSLSYGLNTLKPEIWKKSVEMEIERTSRLPKRRRN
ncbi:mini-chromosome maintenance complex-binding protein [Copidosoma floridanum]|uniref:mini-chromosome maintenance complex-binding protein n=1 Tax=Copidosoma floridanum TaxID=29053 RepID=UPI0006C97F83|nr:mini-chromosome maintenance complex-binding protein [Copidosoma floridanum]